ncbi:MAG: tetratricopeptide repeat protein [Desulfococcaceae bacterium]|jgi:tetratricopeptide (TPR) repeat protein|nr:tetratricopeptide repeat protein [Desulfococcaceae bacterium]
MAKKVTRKQLLKEPDEFLTVSQKAMAFVLTHRVKFISGLGALFSVLIIASLVQYFSVQSENRAFALLSQGMEKYNQIREDKDPKAAFQAVEKDFQQILDQYAGKNGGKMAAISFANMAHDAGEYDKAISLYNTALENFQQKPSVRNLILSGLAHACEGKEDYAGAIKYFEKIASGADALMKEEAVFTLGLLYERMGEKEKSRKEFEKFLKDYPDSSYAQMVKEKTGIRVEKS